jgi:hypothetical protein
VDAAPRLGPRHRLGRTGVQTVEPRASLLRPRCLGGGVDLTIEALNQLTRQCRSFLI